MIPLKDYNPTRSFPLVTLLIIAVNVAFFVEDRLTGGYTRTLVETPEGPRYLVQFMGGLSRHLSLVPAHLVLDFPEAWKTVFTSMFLHGNWLHIGSNMLYFWIFGDNIEDRLGKLRFLLFYFACGCSAAFFQVASDPLSTVPMVGASGAIAGVMAAYLFLFPQARVLTLVPILFFFTTFELPAFLVIGLWVLIQFFNAWVLQGGGMLQGGGVAYFAHVGGFVAGLVLIILLGGRRPRR